MIDEKKVDELGAKRTGITYNCTHCKQYWKSNVKYWAHLGDQLDYIEVYCPACSRPERVR